jgi:hypothetical protein
MSSVDPSVSIDARQRFLQALRRILRPIIRLMIRFGIRYDEFADIARTAYVESALHDGIRDIQTPSVEQISWATGVQRDRVRNCIECGVERLPITRTTTHLITEVLHKWHTALEFLNPYGTPRELDPDSTTGISFQDLVASVDAQADPEAVLSELLRCKSVICMDDGRIKPVTRSYIWPKGSVAGIEYFGLALTDLSRTLEYNFDPMNADNKRLERSMFADRGISPELLPAFHAYSQERATQFLDDLDDWFAQFSDSETDESEKRIVTGVYVFMYVEPPADTRPLSSLTQSAQSESFQR